MIILAFPGMGKTPLAQKQGRYLDLDFGNYREAHDVSKDEEAKLLKSFAKLANIYVDQGYIVLSNEPKLMDVLKVRHVYLPKDSKYSAKKLGVDSDTVSSWIQDWEASARKHSIPVTYVSTGLDHYLGKKGGHRNGN